MTHTSAPFCIWRESVRSWNLCTYEMVVLLTFWFSRLRFSTSRTAAAVASSIRVLDCLPVMCNRLIMSLSCWSRRRASACSPRLVVLNNSCISATGTPVERVRVLDMLAASDIRSLARSGWIDREVGS